MMRWNGVFEGATIENAPCAIGQRQLRHERTMVVTYHLVDSAMEEGHRSFTRYRYTSKGIANDIWNQVRDSLPKALPRRLWGSISFFEGGLEFAPTILHGASVPRHRPPPPL